MRVKIAGKSWTISDQRIYGLCDPMGLTIDLQSGQRPKERLDTMIHEVLHAIRPDVEEDDIIEVANTLTEVLYRDGWRRKKT